MQKKQKNGIHDLIMTDIQTIQDCCHDINKSTEDITIEFVYDTLFFKMGKQMQRIEDCISRIKMNANVLIEEKEHD